MAKTYDPEKNRAMKLRYNYGITVAQYDYMVKRQGGTCAICKRKPDSGGFCIDHDHACCPGKKACANCVRGLLCHYCNTALGGFRDDVESLKNAIKYIEDGGFFE